MKHPRPFSWNTTQTLQSVFIILEPSTEGCADGVLHSRNVFSDPSHDHIWRPYRWVRLRQFYLLHSNLQHMNRWRHTHTESRSACSRSLYLLGQCCNAEARSSFFKLWIVCVFFLNNTTQLWIKWRTLNSPHTRVAEVPSNTCSYRPPRLQHLPPTARPTTRKRVLPLAQHQARHNYFCNKQA